MSPTTITRSTARYDFSAGIVVFLVAVPLCLGIALASGAPFFSGMISGIIGGIVVGLLSNSHVSVSGPAAGLVAIVLAGIATLGSFEAFLLATILCGVLQMAMGVLRLGALAEFFPSGVIRGMLTAIGIIIIIKQLPHGFGYDVDTSFLNDHDVGYGIDIAHALQQIHPGAALVCMLSLALLILCDSAVIKKYLGLFPVGLLVVLAGIGINEWVLPQWDGWFIGEEHRVTIPVAASAQEFFNYFMHPDFSQLSNPDVYVVALTLAAVASIETLLCIEAADRIDTQRRVTSTNRELLAQGAGNMLSGLIGGLPITSVIVRTSANVQAQAKTKCAAIFHGVLLLLSVVAIPHLLNLIPLASLAAILLVVGYKLCHHDVFRRMYKRGMVQFLPFIVTIASILATDLLSGVGIGVMVSLAIILWRNHKYSLSFDENGQQESHERYIRLAQEVSFLNKPAIRHALDRIPDNTHVTMDASSVHYIDSDVIEVIREFVEIKAPQRGIRCDLKGFAPSHRLTVTN